jgi:CheY-like chemotaxis protein
LDPGIGRFAGIRVLAQVILVVQHRRRFVAIRLEEPLMKQVIIAESVLQAVGKSHTLFGRGGVTIYPVRTSEEIITLHRVNRVHLIITDFDLPEMGGMRLCSLIRGDTGLRDVSIVMVCKADLTAVAECKQAGANAVLTEPVDPAELFSRIAELLIIPHRQAMRALLRVSVAGQENKAIFPAISQNISISGMLLETDKKLSPGDRLACSFSIGSREIASEIIVTREVQSRTDKYKYGVKFSNLDTKSLIIIEQFVSGRIKA